MNALKSYVKKHNPGFTNETTHISTMLLEDDLLIAKGRKEKFIENKKYWEDQNRLPEIGDLIDKLRSLQSNFHAIDNPDGTAIAAEIGEWAETLHKIKIHIDEWRKL